MIHCTEQSLFNAEKDSKNANCTSTLDQTAFSKRIKDACHLKSSCSFNIQGLQKAGSSSECGDEAFVYVQAQCEIDRKYTKDRFGFGLLVSCISVFVYLYTLVYFDYLKTVQKNLYVDYDVKTITAGDYTIEFDIDKEAYKHWEENYKDKNSPLNESL